MKPVRILLYSRAEHYKKDMLKGFAPAKYSPTNAAVIKSLFGESNPILVSYKDQKVKADVMNASSLWGEYLPVTVIVTADTVLPNRAVVIGLVE